MELPAASECSSATKYECNAVDAGNLDDFQMEARGFVVIVL
jgi:hypothetical protein